MQIQITDRIEHFIEEYQKYEEDIKLYTHIQERITFGSEYYYELEENLKNAMRWRDIYSKVIAEEIVKEYEYHQKAHKYLYIGSDRKEAEADE